MSDATAMGVAASARVATPLFKAEGLSAAYGRRTVLRNVDFTINEGDFWFMLGPNGEGKTTVVRCVLGLLRPSAGSLWFNPVLGGYKGIGLVPQRCDLNPTLPTTLSEFVLLGLVGIRNGLSDRSDRLSWALERVGLSEKRDQSYWSLSGGQRQRALVARALVRRPRLLVLDEPTNGLDLPSEESLLSFLADLNRQDGMTMLFVTHDLALAARHGSHFALVRGGNVTAGSAKEVLRAETLTRTFGVSLDIGQDVDGGTTIHLAP